MFYKTLLSLFIFIWFYFFFEILDSCTRKDHKIDFSIIIVEFFGLFSTLGLLFYIITLK